MARIALSFALVSIASSLFISGCAANASPDATDQESAAEQKACVYTSTGHVIDCVSPPEPSTAASDEGATPAASSKSSSPNPSASGGLGTVCASLEKLLATELVAAQLCTAGEETPIPQCDAWVPTVNGCEQPVTFSFSAATKQYLETWASYAAECPLKYPPCPDYELLDTSCKPGPSAANHAGLCAIGGGSGPSPTPASK